MDQKKIAWLWLIRENQPISMRELLHKLEAGEVNLPIDIEEFRYPTYLGRSAEYELRGLMDAGLVAVQESGAFDADAQLVTTSTLHRAQDIFSISLTHALTRSDSAVLVEPIFGKAAGAKDKWARIFVAMPFAAELKAVYTDHILKVTQALNISCKRGDDFFSGNSIMSEVWSALYHCDLCIVDCTGRNPNVFYELGIAHTLGRKAILIAQTIDDIPFDIRHLRVIVYEYTPRGMQDFEKTLEQSIRSELNLDA